LPPQFHSENQTRKNQAQNTKRGFKTAYLDLK